ncbi:MAG: hypothetical protein KF752_04330 [Pirellulaceae bacterium]|nr:hypothetical protein [Pirellulaceae bacterium]
MTSLQVQKFALPGWPSAWGAVVGWLVLCTACVVEAHECQCCGCHAACTKVCRLVCEEKKVEVICWGCQCEDFCVPNHSLPDCDHCQQLIPTESGGKAKPVSAKPKKFTWTEWIPNGAQLYTKKKLMKQTINKSVPSYKWVVEDLCATCRQNAPPPQPLSGTQTPAVPAAYSHLPRIGTSENTP